MNTWISRQAVQGPCGRLQLTVDWPCSGQQPLVGRVLGVPLQGSVAAPGPLPPGDKTAVEAGTSGVSVLTRNLWQGHGAPSPGLFNPTAPHVPSALQLLRPLNLAWIFAFVSPLGPASSGFLLVCLASEPSCLCYNICACVGSLTQLLHQGPWTNGIPPGLFKGFTFTNISVALQS